MTNAEAQGQGLALLGYRQVSRRHQLVSRLDRPEWSDELPFPHGDWESRADYYRRVHGPQFMLDSETFKALRRAT